MGRVLVYRKQEGFTGSRGTLLHEAVVDMVKFDLMAYIRMVFPYMTEWANIGIDRLWVYDDSYVAIEVGRYLIDKWAEDR